jgi:hypothetical protein
MKAPGTFWKTENAERFLLLRCRLKSGRWDEVERDIYRRGAATHGRVLALERAARVA